jgi:two-component system chemotaxis sensor kinase CheA
MSVSERILELFADDTSSRLAHMAELLLELETAADPEPVVDALFRDAHTVKGSAALVELVDVARVAHSLEDLLEQLRSGARPVTPAVVDGLLHGVDALRTLTPDVLSGEDRAAAADAAIEQMRRLADGACTPVEEAEAPLEPPTPAPPAAERDAGLPDRRRTEAISVAVSRVDDMARLAGESAAAQLRLSGTLSGLGGDPRKNADYRDLSRSLSELQEHANKLRMVPVATLVEQVRRQVRELARSLGKPVAFEVVGAETEIDRGLLSGLTDMVMHCVRNAVDHGLESAAERAAAGKPATGKLALAARQIGSEVVITITDDGRGLDLDRLRNAARAAGVDSAALSDDEARFLIFRSGVSTAAVVSEVSGRGVGLDAVREAVHAMRGRIEVSSERGKGTEFRIFVPLSLSMLRCLIVQDGGQRLGVPLHSVVTVLQPDEPVLSVDGRFYVRLADGLVPLTSLRSALAGTGTGRGPIVILAGLTRRHAVQVDELVGQREVVVSAISDLLPAMEALIGVSIEPDGAILLVVDATGVIDRARALGAPKAQQQASAAPSGSAALKVVERPRQHVLVVDDALTIRELQRSILERAGYRVTVAGDGVEAMTALAAECPDLVLTDLEMPRMNGLDLTRSIRATDPMRNLPVVMLTSLGDELDRQRGLDAGADAYIVKSSFDEATLLDAVARLLGAAA